MRFFDSSFSKILEDQEVAAVNLMETGKVSFKAPSISISIRDDALEFVRTKTIDGRPCLVIEMNDGLEISGLPPIYLPLLKQFGSYQHKTNKKQMPNLYWNLIQIQRFSLSTPA